MGSATFQLLETKRGKPNRIYKSAEQEICDGPHRYDPTIHNNKAVGYVPIAYEHQEYPKLVYHPKFGSVLPPDPAKFSVGAVTQEQIMNANAAYETALTKWKRENRTMLIALTEQEALRLAPEEQLKVLKEREEKLLKKGWLPVPPKTKELVKFDLASDEI